MSSSDSNPLRADAINRRERGDLVGALRCLDRVMESGDANLDDWRSAGVMLSQLGEFSQAIGVLDRAIALEPDDAESNYELGRAAYQLGDIENAVKRIEKVAIATGSVAIWQSLATIAPAAPSFDHARVRQIRQRYAGMVRRSERVETPPTIRRRIDGGSPFRIGYLSAHWHDANYMKPVWPTINAHEPNRHEIHLFDDSDVADPKWSWLNLDPVHRHRVTELSNRELADRIRRLEIDVLIDLSGYSVPHRLGVFVHRPAPIQVAWFNSFATSGFTEFDYIIGDDAVIRNEEQRHYVEKFVSLPLSYLTFRTNHESPDVVPSPHGESASFTFGCLGTQYKISHSVLDAWSEILVRAPSTQLVLANRVTKSSQNREYLIEEFERRGVESTRIQFLPPAKHYDFLAYYNRIDLALDTFPYNGGTTTMEAIWQGVPVLCLDGDRWASRTSATLMHHGGLDRYVAKSIDDYVRQATLIASDESQRAQLRSLRTTLRQQLSASPVCDTTRLAHELESAYASMLKRSHDKGRIRRRPKR